MADILRHPEMQGRRDESWRITRTGKIVRKTLVYKICHTLSWCRLLAIPLLPTVTFELFLEMHHAQRVVTRDILSAHFNDHTTVRPLTASIARAHAVDNNLFFISSGRNDEPTRTHAERIDSAPVNLGDKRIFRRRQILSASLLIMILYLVNQLRGMFQTYTYRNTLGLDFNLGIRQIPIDIAGRVSCSQNHRTTKLFIGSQTANHSIIFQYETGHFCLEMYFTTTTENGVTHGLDDTRQLIGANMWMGISQNIRRCAMLAEHIENLLNRASFLRTCI